MLDASVAGHTVTAAFGTLSVDPSFTATATLQSVSDAAFIEKVSGDQTANQFGFLEAPLVVLVRDQRGQRLSGVTVTFLARDGGKLSDPGGNVQEPQKLQMADSY